MNPGLLKQWRLARIVDLMKWLSVARVDVLLEEGKEGCSVQEVLGLACFARKDGIRTFQDQFWEGLSGSGSRCVTFAMGVLEALLLSSPGKDSR